MPPVIYVLAAGIFAMVTSEFTVSGLMPQLAESLGVSVSQVGYLVTVFALAMAIGGPILSVVLLRRPPRQALLILFLIFLVGNLLAAGAVSYPMMLIARLVTGAASGAFFGIALTVAGNLVVPALRGRAMAAALQGLTLGTTLGLPLATLVGGLWGWRAAFIAIGVLTLIAAIATAAGLRRVAVPTPTAEAAPSLRGEIQAFRSWRLWAAMASSLLIIAATFTAFSYLTPVLHEETGVDLAIVPLLLLAYGVATVVGNIVVGRLASAHTFAVLLIGTTLNVGFLVSFALFAQVPAAAIIAMLGIGLLGVTMNPAMITRVQRVSNTGSLVNTVHTSMITLGVALGSTLGGLGITAFGLRAPLWIGAGFAVLAVLTMIPAAINARRARLALAA